MGRLACYMVCMFVSCLGTSADYTRQTKFAVTGGRGGLHCAMTSLPGDYGSVTDLATGLCKPLDEAWFASKTYTDGVYAEKVATFIRFSPPMNGSDGLFATNIFAPGGFGIGKGVRIKFTPDTDGTIKFVFRNGQTQELVCDINMMTHGMAFMYRSETESLSLHYGPIMLYPGVTLEWAFAAQDTRWEMSKDGVYYMAVNYPRGAPDGDTTLEIQLEATLLHEVQFYIA